MQLFLALLKKVKIIAAKQADGFASEGFKAFWAMLNQELDDEYFAAAENHLRELKFDDGVLISAALGMGNKGVNYTLRKPKENLHRRKLNWLQRIFRRKVPDIYTFEIDGRDETGARALAELTDRGIAHVADSLAQAVDHILSFFTMLRTELAFYVGCLNLYERLTEIGGTVCFPRPAVVSERRHSCTGLYDISLALTLGSNVVGNTVRADGKDFALITGANQGGKSTFLRSIGLAQLMMQCGMFVPAQTFCVNVCTGLFTHYKREEDTAMNSGKLDEELNRMSDIVNQITANSLILFNESFAATNEREGSEIARQIIRGLLEKRIKVFFVTHLYDLAHSFYNQTMYNIIFLRAERQSDGGRTFKIVEGQPLATSYGVDLYNKIFGDSC